MPVYKYIRDIGSIHLFSIKMNKIIRWRNLPSKIYHLRARKQWLSWELNMWKISYLVSLDIFCFCAWSKMEHNILIREIKYANLVRKRHFIFSFHFRFLCDETKFYLQLSFIPFDKWIMFLIESDFKGWIRFKWNEKLYFYCKRNNKNNTVKEGFEMIFDLCKS